MFWGWSLALEEQFYLVVPALFFVLHRIKHEKSRIAFLVVLAFGALARRLWMLYFKGPWTPLTLYTSLYFRTPTRYDALVWGVLLAIVYQRWGTQIRQWLSSPRARASLAVPSLGLWWVISTPDLFGPQYEDLVHVLSWGTLTCAMYYGFVLLLLQGEGLVAHLLGAEFFRKTATLGYGVYLVHIPLCYEVLVPLARRLVDKNIPMAVIWPVSLFTVLAISFVLAYVLHVLVEKPALRLRQALTG
jgi:peptidoglycan/LPS O-acetylase OafA/YrhL